MGIWLFLSFSGFESILNTICQEVFVVSPWLDLTFSTASVILNRPWDYLPNFFGDHVRVGEDRTQWFISF